MYIAIQQNQHCLLESAIWLNSLPSIHASPVSVHHCPLSSVPDGWGSAWPAEGNASLLSELVGLYLPGWPVPGPNSAPIFALQTTQPPSITCHSVGLAPHSWQDREGTGDRDVARGVSEPLLRMNLDARVTWLWDQWSLSKVKLFLWTSDTPTQPPCYHE